MLHGAVMRRVLIPLIALAASAAPLCAQTPLEARISRNIVPGPKQFGEVPADDQKIVISKVAELMERHVTFRNDGTSAAYFHAPNGRHSIEWRNLRIKMIIPFQLTEEDKANGIHKRYQALLIHDACRLWDKHNNTWQSWGPHGHPLFPAAININWKGRLIEADGGMYLPKFQPGPTITTNEPLLKPDTTASEKPGTAPSTKGLTEDTFKPSGGGSGLPPGMSRGK